MNKFNVQITAIVVAGVVLVSAIWATCLVLKSGDKGLFDYLVFVAHPQLWNK